MTPKVMVGHEKWKEITGYSDYSELYHISSHGRVRSVRSGKIMKGSIDRYGYHYVKLSNSKQIKAKVHRLVALAFLPNPDNLPFINHKDEVNTNNHIDNLEWCTLQYNTEYSCSKKYEVLTPDGMCIDVFNMAKFCRENNLDNGTMHKVMRGIGEIHKGYRVWRLE